MAKNRGNSDIPCNVNFQLMWVHRQKMGLSMQQLGDIIGVNKTAIWGWEQGKFKPKLRQLVKFAKAVGQPSARIYVDSVYQQAILTFERKIAVWIDDNHDILDSITKGDIALMRVLKQMDKIESSEDDVSGDETENPLHNLANGTPANPDEFTDEEP